MLAGWVQLNGLDPEAYLANVLARIADHPARHIDTLLPWSWQQEQQLSRAA